MAATIYVSQWWMALVGATRSPFFRGLVTSPLCTAWRSCSQQCCIVSPCVVSSPCTGASTTHPSRFCLVVPVIAWDTCAKQEPIAVSCGYPAGLLWGCCGAGSLQHVMGLVHWWLLSVWYQGGIHLLRLWMRPRFCSVSAPVCY